MDGLADRLVTFAVNFAHHFKSTTGDVSAHAQDYITGLLSKTQRKNIERMNENTGNTDYQNIQYMISESTWDYQAVVADIGKQANGLIGGHQDCCLLIDESAHTKKGQASVGVSRQWNGRLGKTDNCQVGVYSCLSTRAAFCPIGVRLFLPKCWTEDPKRLDKAKVPEASREFKTKIELAEELITEAREQGIDYKWVGFDELYGRSRPFLARLADAGETFVGDIPSNTKVTLVGESKEKKVSDLIDEVSWKEVKVRDSTKGEIWLEAAAVSVKICIDSKSGDCRQWQLIVSRPVGGGEVKYSLTNALLSLGLERLCFMQRQRFWVERDFQDAKSNCGMSQYQVRGWLGWHHHMALVMLAMLFLLNERMIQMTEIPMLSCSDIVVLLDHYFCTQDEATLREQLKFRHKQRSSDIVSAYRRQAAKRASTGNLTK